MSNNPPIKGTGGGGPGSLLRKVFRPQFPEPGRSFSIILEEKAKEVLAVSGNTYTSIVLRYMSRTPTRILRDSLFLERRSVLSSGLMSLTRVDALMGCFDELRMSADFLLVRIIHL